MTAFHTEFTVPVAGGELAVGVAGPGELGAAPMVLGVHGITSSHRMFAAVARHLAARGIAFVVPDLRGRGASAGLPGPYGLDTHVADLAAVLDHCGGGRAILAGHSMGAYVVARLAAAHPERAAGVVLIDGGLSPKVPATTDPDAVLDAVLGPALARLRMTFASLEEYRDFWRCQPAFRHRWNSDIESYVDYDLAGPAGARRVRVVEAAVRSDGRDVLDSATAWAVLAMRAALPEPVVLVRAPRGFLDDPHPLIPGTVVEQAKRTLPGMRDVLIDDTNHYMIVLGDREATAVAGEIARVAAA